MKRSMGHAFTLVELLIIVGILVVLITLVMPTLTHVKQQAYVPKCQSNQASLFAGLTMYANEYGEYPATGQRWVMQKNNDWVDAATHTAKDAKGNTISNYDWEAQDPNYKYDANFGSDKQYDDVLGTPPGAPREVMGTFSFGCDPGTGVGLGLPLEPYINSNYQMMQCQTMPYFNLKPYDGKNPNRHNTEGLWHWGRLEGDPNVADNLAIPDLGMGFWYSYNGPNVTAWTQPGFNKDAVAGTAGYADQTHGITGWGAEHNRMSILSCQGGALGYWGVSFKDGGRHLCNPQNPYRNNWTSVADVAFYACPSLMEGARGNVHDVGGKEREPHLTQTINCVEPIGDSVGFWTDSGSDQAVCRNYTFGDGHVVFINRPTANFGPSDHF